jgi:two-component system, sensor histidine kinase and response regulator
MAFSVALAVLVASRLQRVISRPILELARTAQMDAGAAVIDEKLIRQRIGDDPELLQELIGIFRDTSPALLQKIRRAVTETNGPALRNAAHALKGSVSNFAATRAYEVSGRLEVMGETQVFTDANSACDLLEQEIAALNSALRSRVLPREART